MTSRDPESQKGLGHEPNILRAQYLDNGWRYKLGSNGLPIGNGPLRFEWSHNWWRHVTQRGEGQDPQYIWGPLSRQRLEIRTCANVEPIGNGYLGIKCSRDRWPRVPERSMSWPQYTYGSVSRKRLKMQTWFQWTTNRKWSIEIRMVMCLMTSRDPDRSRSCL